MHICGTRGSTSAPGDEFARYGGHTSCVAIGRDQELPDLILDAGTGIRRVTALLQGQPFHGTILLGHLHWDHTNGLPFFRGGDHPDSRVDVYLPEQGEDPMATLEKVMAPPHFPITPTELDGRWRFLGLDEGTHRIEGYEVVAREIPHKGGRTFGYRISDGAATVAYVSDHYPAALGAGPEGFGPYHDAALALAAEVDLLIHDSQYLDEEWAAQGNFGHSTASYAIGLAKAAAVRKLLMFHHDPTRTDHDLDLLTEKWKKQAPLDVETAFEGQVIDVTGTRN